MAEDPAVWFVVAAGREQGPVPASHVLRYIGEGKITRETKVRRADMPTPIPAGKVPSFFPANVPGGGAAVDIAIDPRALAAPPPPAAEPAPEPAPPAPPQPPASAQLIAGAIDTVIIAAPMAIGAWLGIVQYLLPITIAGVAFAWVWLMAFQIGMGGGPGKRMLRLAVVDRAGGRAGILGHLVRHAPILLTGGGLILLHLSWCAATPPPAPPINMDRPTYGMFIDHLPARAFPLLDPGVVVTCLGALWWLAAGIATVAGAPFMDRLAGTAVIQRRKAERALAPSSASGSRRISRTIQRR